MWSPLKFWDKISRMRVPGYLKVHTPAKASAAHAGVRRKGGGWSWSYTFSPAAQCQRVGQRQCSQLLLNLFFWTWDGKCPSRSRWARLALDTAEESWDFAEPHTTKSCTDETGTQAQMLYNKALGTRWQSCTVLKFNTNLKSCSLVQKLETCPSERRREKIITRPIVYFS